MKLNKTWFVAYLYCLLCDFNIVHFNLESLADKSIKTLEAINKIQACYCRLFSQLRRKSISYKKL